MDFTLLLEVSIRSWLEVAGACTFVAFPLLRSLTKRMLLTNINLRLFPPSGSRLRVRLSRYIKPLIDFIPNIAPSDTVTL